MLCHTLPLPRSTTIIHTQPLFELPGEQLTRRKRVKQYKPKKYKRRVPREYERGPAAVGRAIPKGHMRPVWAMDWLQAVFKSDHINALNSQARENVKKLALVMARSVEPSSMTIRPGWDYLITRSGLSRSTVNRIRQRLHDAGLLGTVAKGVNAEWSPSHENERAVYVLLVKSSLKAVDKSEPATANFEEIPPRTRTGAILADVKKDVATPRQTFEDSPEGLVSVALPASRPQPLWHGSQTTKSAGNKGARRESERQAAAELQRKFFELRRTTTADVATRCRKFFMAGWTITDIARALDFMPGGGQWAHDGANGIRDVGRWMEYRLAAWVRDGTVLPSHGQRILANARRVKAIQRKTLDERAVRLERLPEQDRTNKIGAALAKAVLRGDAIINPDTGEVTWNASGQRR